ncbi:hypothetical protein DPMN_029888, partial [Dreissena polymorpha]
EGLYGKRNRLQLLPSSLISEKQALLPTPAGIIGIFAGKKSVYKDGGGLHDTGGGNDNLLFNSKDQVEVRLHRR